MRSMPEVETGEANRVWCDPNQATCVWAAVCSHDLHGHCGALWRRWCRASLSSINSHSRTTRKCIGLHVLQTNLLPHFFIFIEPSWISKLLRRAEESWLARLCRRVELRKTCEIGIQSRFTGSLVNKVQLTLADNPTGHMTFLSRKMIPSYYYPGTVQ